MSADDRLLPPAAAGSLRAEMRATQRDRLVRAVAEVAGTRGYARTTVALVADAAGVSRKTFYVHFPDLEQCLLAAYDRATAAVQAALADVAVSPAPWRDRLAAATATYLDLYASEPAFARLALLEMWTATPATRDRAVDTAARVAALYRRANDAARAEDPAVRAATDDELDALVGGLHRLMVLRVLRGDPASLGELAPLVVANVLAVVQRT
jgi:AcrR family transcriptional regulator